MLNHRRTRMFRWTASGVLVLAGFVSNLGAQPATSGAAQTPTASHRTLVNDYCLSCHNSRAKTAGLELDTINALQLDENRETWEKVVRKLHARQMPPAGIRRPDEATYLAALASLEGALDQLAAADPNPGRTETFRRLNRTEYHNAIRDLLELEVDVASLLPSDSSSFGFDNVTVGDLSPTLLERYVAAAEKISRLAVGRPGRAPDATTVRIRPDVTQEKHLVGLPVGTRGGAQVSHTFLTDGEYEVTIRLARDRNEHVEGLTEPHELELLLDDERLQVFTVAPPPRMDGHASSYQPSHDNLDEHLKTRIPVTAGQHTLGVTFPAKPSVLLETARQPYEAHFNYYRHPRIQPAVYEVSIIGPYNVSGPGDTPSRHRIFTCEPISANLADDCARRILSGHDRVCHRLERQALSRRRPRPVLAVCGRLGRERRQRSPPDHQGAGDGAETTVPGDRPVAPLRPGLHVRERGLPGAPGCTRDRLQHEPPG